MILLRLLIILALSCFLLSGSENIHNGCKQVDGYMYIINGVAHRILQC